MKIDDQKFQTILNRHVNLVFDIHQRLRANNYNNRAEKQNDVKRYKGCLNRVLYLVRALTDQQVEEKYNEALKKLEAHDREFDAIKFKDFRASFALICERPRLEEECLIFRTERNRRNSVTEVLLTDEMLARLKYRSQFVCKEEE